MAKKPMNQHSRRGKVRVTLCDEEIISSRSTSRRAFLKVAFRSSLLGSSAVVLAGCVNPSDADSYDYASYYDADPYDGASSGSSSYYDTDTYDGVGSSDNDMTVYADGYDLDSDAYDNSDYYYEQTGD